MLDLLDYIEWINDQEDPIDVHDLDRLEEWGE